MDLLPELYDPRSSRALVRAHRPHAGGAASDVVSDAVWSDVLGLVRWAQATLCCSGEMAPGVAWRTAAASAVLLRRWPAFCDERGECWPVPLDLPVPGGTTPRERLRAAADRLWSRLRTPEEEVPLGVLAVDVDAVGAAAVGLVAEGADWERMG
ncbi:MAG TPA: hypothetical protein VGO74_03230 [Modestobacter sp.]|jgi:hypothetical protein|nr:hypothetical protein [Modestobacter sp.]